MFPLLSAPSANPSGRGYTDVSPELQLMVKNLKLFQPKRIIKPRERETRGSRHDRGYDSTWVKRTEIYRKSHPFCAECHHFGRVELCDVIDHKIPVRDRPDLRLDPQNWWPLCHRCHNGIKAKMERAARRMEMIDLLPIWCDDPTTRPPGLSEERKNTQELRV